MENRHAGGCYCGNINFEMVLSNPLNQYNPRECDCDFCQRHGARYISDKDGALIIIITDAQLLSNFRQGSMTADFLICKSCGILVAACYHEDKKIYAAINSRALHKKPEIGQPTIVSPEKSAAHDKAVRWKIFWFPDVKMLFGNNPSSAFGNSALCTMVTPDITFKEARTDDIPHLAIHHRKMFEEIWEKKGLALDCAKAKEIEKSHSAKLKKQLADNSCRVWIVTSGDQIVASGAVSIVSLTPVPNDINHNVAFLHSMYTEKEFRGRTLAKQIIEKAIQYCKTNGIHRVILNASDAGKPIYEKLGFTSTPESMRLFLE